VEDKLNKFLSYLQNEKGFSPGTVEVYQLDLEKGLFPSLAFYQLFSVAGEVNTEFP